MLGRQIWRNLTGSMSSEAYKLMFAGCALGFVVVYASTHMESFWALIFGLFTIVCGYGVCSLMVNWLLNSKSEKIKNMWKLNALLAVSVNTIVPGSAHLMVGMLLLSAGCDKVAKRIKD